MVFPMVAEGAPLADRVDKVLIDSVGVSPFAMDGGGSRLVLLGRRPWPLLRWRPQPTLLGWHHQPTLLEWRSQPLQG